MKLALSSKDLNASAGGSGQPFVSQAILDNLAIPLPPIEEQTEIVRRVDSLFNLADTIESQIATASARVEKTVQAVLAKAFRGELVTAEAES